MRNICARKRLTSQAMRPEWVRGGGLVSIGVTRARICVRLMLLVSGFTDAEIGLPILIICDK